MAQIYYLVSIENNGQTINRITSLAASFACLHADADVTSNLCECLPLPLRDPRPPQSRAVLLIFHLALFHTAILPAVCVFYLVRT